MINKNQIGTDIVEPLLAKVFGNKNNCKAVFNILEELAITTVKQDDNVKLNTKSLANIQNGTALNQIGANVSTCMNVFKTSKGKIKAVSDALKKIINESDNNKKASDAFIKTLKTIIGEPGSDNGVNNRDHLNLFFNNKASLLFKWMYVDASKWNAPGVNGKDHHDAAIDSFVNLLACFLNKNASYKGVANSTKTIIANSIVWHDNNGNDGKKSTLLHDDDIKKQLGNDDNAIMIEKVKKVKIYFDNTLVPKTYQDITVSALSIETNNNIIIDDAVTADKRHMMYYIFQLVGGHDKYTHRILGKEQGLSRALQ